MAAGVHAVFIDPRVKAGVVHVLALFPGLLSVVQIGGVDSATVEDVAWVKAVPGDFQMAMMW